jgi:histidinol-phosphate phosphatase family protein
VTERRKSFGAERRGVFIDRDGTLIVDRHYLNDPEQVELVPEASNAVRYINYALIPVIVVTNQSGIARGIISSEQYERVKARIDDKLAERNAFIDATFVCPHHPDFTGPCECRKPGTALFRQAIEEFGLAPERCVYIGDRWHDIAPALELGGRGILVPSIETPGVEMVRAAEKLEIAPSLTAAVHSVVAPPA